MTPYSHEFNRVLLGFLLALALITLAAVYWATFGPERLLSRDDNPRLVEAQASIRRGAILDRHESPLVETTVNENGQIIRTYLEPSAYSMTGYYSLKYGTGLAEAAYNDLLSGADVAETFSSQFDQDVLHMAPVGTDIRLTIDLELQSALASALADSRGAGVVLSVPDGQLLASVSLPIYDPNTLDENWDHLVKDPGDPFFNRALQGRYQPGGIFYIPLLISAVMNNADLEERYPDSKQPVVFDDITLVCQRNSARTQMTLAQAYRYGCAKPFADMIDTLGEAKVNEALQFFDFDSPVTLEGFLPGGEEEEAPESTSEITPEPTTDTVIYPFTETALGQGDIVVSPLHFATLMAAIINDGNAPEPHALLATRSPDSTEWRSIEAPRQSLPIMTKPTAEHIAQVMQSTTASYGLYLDGYDIGAYPAIAYAGDRTLTWFAAFARAETGKEVVVVIVIEDSDDLSKATQVGMQVLGQAITTQQAND